MRRILATVGAAGLLLSPTAVAHAQNADCAQPTVNTLISAEAAVSRPAINSPSEYALSNVYASLSQTTKPQFVYAEAGPQFAGAFEALVPPGSPSLPRSVAAYPSTDIPDDDTTDWGGRSRTSVTPISAAAVSNGTQPQDFEGFTVSNSESWVSSIVECDTITVIAGWRANDVVLAPGATVEQLGQEVTLVVGPGGASSDVETTLVGAQGFDRVPLEGRPSDPLTDPIAEGGGPRIDVGEPRTSADTDGASASGGGFNFLFLDPEAGQGAGYRLGSVNAQIDVLGPLEVSGPGVDLDDGTPTTTVQSAETVVPPPKQETPPQVPESESSVGTPPPPSPSAETAIERISTVSVSLDDITVESTRWTPLIVFVVSVLLFAQITAAIRIGRRWDPTLDWIAVKGDKAVARFVTQYLKW